MKNQNNNTSQLAGKQTVSILYYPWYIHGRWNATIWQLSVLPVSWSLDL